jgi:plastocyanin
MTMSSSFSPIQLLSHSFIKKASAQIAQGTFPPPIFDTLSREPSLVIRIPAAQGGYTHFAPGSVSIPAGLTVAWFNDDAGEHTVTTIQNSTYPSPEAIDSGPILPGGSFFHQFTKPGIYYYVDTLNPNEIAKISVGNAVVDAHNFNMRVGGYNSIPFDPKNLSSTVLRFIPKTVAFPPDISMTYRVTISNSTGQLFTSQFDDDDGILDLDLMPTRAAAAVNSTTHTTIGTANHFIDWGPDFIGQEAHNNDGTYHIQGPMLNSNSTYYITVSIISKDNSALNPPVSDTFPLPPKQQ